MNRRKPTKLLAGVLLPAIAALALTGCGGSSNAATSKTSDISRQKARAAFENCLRQHGVNITQNESGGQATFRVGDKGAPAFQSAMQACRRYLGSAFGNITPAQRAQFRQQLVKFTACLRAHGQNVPDPTFSDTAPGQGPPAGGPPGGGPATSSGSGERSVFGGIDRNSPAFQAAAKACQSNLPKPPGGGIRIAVGGGGGPASAPGGK